MNAEHPRDALRRCGVTANRRLGQNFLVSPGVASRIVEEAQVCREDVVLEVGTGLGILTEHLAAQAAAVISVEIDRRLCEVARERLGSMTNLRLLCADFLEGKHSINPLVTAAVREAAAGRRLKVVSNLPYQIATPAVLNLLGWEVPVCEMDVMLQVEVVERFRAQPGSSEYGPSSVVVAYWAGVEEVFRMPASAFWPQPGVSSCFVRLRPRPPDPEARSYRAFIEVVSKLFQSRRKTLGRAMELAWGRDVAQRLLGEAQLDRSLRPGNLTPAQFVRLADVLDEVRPQGGEALR